MGVSECPLCVPLAPSKKGGPLIWPIIQTALQAGYGKWFGQLAAPGIRFEEFHETHTHIYIYIYIWRVASLMPVLLGHGKNGDQLFCWLISKGDPDHPTRTSKSWCSYFQQDELLREMSSSQRTAGRTNVHHPASTAYKRGVPQQPNKCVESAAPPPHYRTMSSSGPSTLTGLKGNRELKKTKEAFWSKRANCAKAGQRRLSPKHIHFTSIEEP